MVLGLGPSTMASGKKPEFVYDALAPSLLPSIPDCVFKPWFVWGVSVLPICLSVL